ncbi:guanine nucleotide binding protein (G-protein), alpha subunit, partial [Kipferlia bialata]|eukprot:g11772.t1
MAFTACMGKSDKQAAIRNKQINSLIKKNVSTENNTVRVLLLGPGGSGKSTIFRQMRVLYKEGFSQEQRIRYRRHIVQNILVGMKDVLTAAASLGLRLDTPEHQRNGEYLSRLDRHYALMHEDYAKIKDLWVTDSAIKRAWQQRNAYQLEDSLAYFMAEIDRVSAADYVPTKQDVLNCRVKTIGIHETDFVVDGLKFQMTDVGGQRNQRRKWIHCFEDVTAVIFVASASAYDQVLEEDGQTNRMEEALRLFDEMCNSRWFYKIPFILFLNK